jgi:ABC-type transport system substrate-binding protein
MAPRVLHSLKSVLLILATISLVSCGPTSVVPAAGGDPPTVTPTPEPVVLTYPGEVQNVEAVDEHTAHFTLSDPVAGPHFNLFGSVPIIAKHIWEGAALALQADQIDVASFWGNEVTKARQILRDAGLEGHAVTIIQSGWDREAELIQSDLEAIGLQVTVKPGDRTTIDGLLKEGRFDMAINGHGGIANPSTLRTPTWPATTYQNEAYDALFVAQSVEMDDDKGQEQIWELQAGGCCSNTRCRTPCCRSRP